NVRGWAVAPVRRWSRWPVRSALTHLRVLAVLPAALPASPGRDDRGGAFSPDGASARGFGALRAGFGLIRVVVGVARLGAVAELLRRAGQKPVGVQGAVGVLLAVRDQAHADGDVGQACRAGHALDPELRRTGDVDRHRPAVALLERDRRARLRGDRAG